MVEDDEWRERIAARRAEITEQQWRDWYNSLIRINASPQTGAFSWVVTPNAVYDLMNFVDDNGNYVCQTTFGRN